MKCHGTTLAYYVEERRYGCTYAGSATAEEAPPLYPNVEFIDGHFKYTGDLRGFTGHCGGYYAWIVGFLASHKAVEGPTLDIGGYDGPYRMFLPTPYESIDWAERIGNDGLINRSSNTYGMVLSTETLEHLPNPYATIQEMYRCLKPGGVLLVTAPLYWGYHPDPHDYWRIMPSTWERLARELPFVNVELNHIILANDAASTHFRAQKPLIDAEVLS